MTVSLDPERIARCYQTASAALLDERVNDGHWVGELSTSALSTATAILALELFDRHRCAPGGSRSNPRGADESVTHITATLPAENASSLPDFESQELRTLIENGLSWLVEHQNADGGWGDTVKSISNISTSMLAHAVFHATGTVERFPECVARAQTYIDQTGGVAAVLRRYGKDRTFSIPILTHCALAGLVDWRDVIPLPFELACVPAQFYKTVRLPVVSYALPALIAIGQARFYHKRPRNPLSRWIRRLAIRPSLRVLEKIQPPNGGFLEATPLTSFVTMSLASMGLVNHPVTRRGLGFIVSSVRDDGSWPIDTNLATWVTTLSVNALQDDIPADTRTQLTQWLINQQYRRVHAYTNAPPGGWAWTDLPGGVPDADDTPGAVLALLNLHQDNNISEPVYDALQAAVRWLLDLQNRDSGWPTFCRGWGTLPFDRSSADLTAHTIRALHAFQNACGDWVEASLRREIQSAIENGFRYLNRRQRPDGSWLPLWFGNQLAVNDENPTYGTTRVLAAYRDTRRLDAEPSRRGLNWLASVQNVDGGWGGAAGVVSSNEETALAVEILLSADEHETAARRGLSWLLQRVEDGHFQETTPIGFYFAKLWYFERLYPFAFCVSALRRARQLACGSASVDCSRNNQEHLHQTASD